LTAKKFSTGVDICAGEWYVFYAKISEGNGQNGGNFSVYNFVAQALGILALVIMVLSYQQKTRKGLLCFQMASNACFVANYLMIGGYTFALMSVVNIARSFVFLREENGDAWAKSRIWLYVFLTTPVLFGIWMWENILSLLVIAATMVLAVALYSKNGKTMRRLFLLPPLLYISYNVSHGALGGIGSDVFCLISAIIAIYRFDIKKEASHH
jgi:hypothetical protein